MYRSKNVVYLDVRCSDSCAIIVQIPLYNISCTIRCMIFCYSGKCSGKNKTRKIMLTLSRLNAPNNILGQ